MIALASVHRADADWLASRLPAPLAPIPSARLIQAWSMADEHAAVALHQVAIPCRLAGMPCHYILERRLVRARIDWREARRTMTARPPLRLEASLARLHCWLAKSAPAHHARLVGACPDRVEARQWLSAPASALSGFAPPAGGRWARGLALVAAHSFDSDISMAAGRVLFDRPSKSQIHASHAHAA